MAFLVSGSWSSLFLTPASMNSRFHSAGMLRTSKPWSMSQPTWVSCEKLVGPLMEAPTKPLPRFLASLASFFFCSFISFSFSLILFLSSLYFSLAAFLSKRAGDAAAADPFILCCSLLLLIDGVCFQRVHPL